MSHVFRGRTLNEARSAAERELGSDVIVLQKRKVRKPGLSGMLGASEFEIEAGRPVSTALLTEKIRSREQEFQPAMLFAAGAYDDQSLPQQIPANELHKLRDEVRAMRAMLFRISNQPKGLQNELNSIRRAVDSIAPISEPLGRASQLLSASGIDGTIAREIAQQLQGKKGNDAALRDAYLDSLAELIKIRPWPLARKEKSLIAVVGPPGVGKTTTAAKLAARAISHDKKSVSFITCDTYRVGAVEQLKRYASLLNCPITVVKKPEELERAIARAKTDLIVVDTAGRGPTRAQSVEAALGAKCKDGAIGWDGLTRHVLLCLPAAMRYHDTEAAVAKYAPCAPTAIAVTKLDLTTTPGGLIHGPACSRLPISTLCMGQRVPEDVAPATAGRILDYLAPPAHHN